MINLMIFWRSDKMLLPAVSCSTLMLRTIIPMRLKNLLATPRLIHWGIDASIEAIDPYLPDEYASIGLSVNFVHTAPTSLGMTVTVHASIIAITDHDVTLSVKAWDEQGEIGHGTHKRSIVLKQTVLDKAEERTKLLMVRQANKQIEEMRR